MCADGGTEDIQSPRPICVVTVSGSSTQNDTMQVVLDNELLIDDSYMDPNSRFGISPFTINLTHKDAPLECQLNLEKALKAQNDEDQKRYNASRSHNSISVNCACAATCF